MPDFILEYANQHGSKFYYLPDGELKDMFLRWQVINCGCAHYEEERMYLLPKLIDLFKYSTVCFTPIPEGEDIIGKQIIRINNLDITEPK